MPGELKVIVQNSASENTVLRTRKQVLYFASLAPFKVNCGARQGESPSGERGSSGGEGPLEDKVNRR